MKPEYEDLVEHADTPRDNRTIPIIVTWCFISPRQQYRVCAIVSGSPVAL